MIKNDIYQIVALVLCLNVCIADTQRPNVIVIMTDDQGYGDLSAHGNPVLKTPHLDKFREQSVRFTDFHVAPKCTPTRGQLMTGIDAMRNGATRVCQGRSMVRSELKMMPQYFADAGYATGMFGKWHLGDSYPYQPRFRGFQEVLSFRAWGITSLADYWGNDYFDPILEHNGVDKKYKGYCTDIFFNEAIKWIDQCKSRGKPFFAYIPTNTPHVPEQVDKKYSAPYQGKFQGQKIPAAFYGMIVNIDKNIGKLEQYLEDNRLQDNTILVFLSDNGTQNDDAMRLFNAGMRNKKGTVYEGGHRVSLFVRWVDGNLKHGTDIAELTTVQDLLPTLMDLCGLKGDRSDFNGYSLAGLLKGTRQKLPQRMVVNQIGYTCSKWDQTVVMNGKWRLIGANQLYNIADDPHQDNNIYDKHPRIAQAMNLYYDQWYNEARQLFEKERYIIIGSDKQNPLNLYANDWQGGYCDNRGNLRNGNAKGYWDVIVERGGAYEVELRRWPQESGKALTDSFNGKSKTGAIPIAKARLQIGDFDQTVVIKPKDTMVKFSVNLKKGQMKLMASFLDEQSKVICGAMYVKVNFLNEITIAEILKDLGCATGCFGKWNLGDQPELLSNNYGYDYYFRIPYSHDMWPPQLKSQNYKKGIYPLPVLRNNEMVDIVESMKDQTQLRKPFTDEAVEFIKKNQDKPFFVYLPHALVHHSRRARGEFLIKVGIENPAELNKKTGDSVELLYARVGESPDRASGLFCWANPRYVTRTQTQKGYVCDFYLAGRLKGNQERIAYDIYS